MNATAIGVHELTCQLLDAADGIPADVAAAGLIISHGHFLHPTTFRRTITAGTSTTPASLAASSISRDAAPHRPGERAAALRIFLPGKPDLRIAASLGDPAIPVRLRTVPGQPRHPHHHAGSHRDHHRQRLNSAASRAARPAIRLPHPRAGLPIDLPAAPGPSPAC